MSCATLATPRFPVDFSKTKQMMTATKNAIAHNNLLMVIPSYVCVFLRHHKRSAPDCHIPVNLPDTATMCISSRTTTAVTKPRRLRRGYLSIPAFTCTLPLRTPLGSIRSNVGSASSRNAPPEEDRSPVPGRYEIALTPSSESTTLRPLLSHGQPPPNPFSRNSKDSVAILMGQYTSRPPAEE